MNFEFIFLVKKIFDRNFFAIKVLIFEVIWLVGVYLILSERYPKTWIMEPKW